ncbi:MAG: FHA domain-containing protein [Armatimonadetes bacterium]|nr:FHA domain-containing protein [Armatimonadota bacterium]
MTDQRTQMISAPPSIDPNKTIMGTAPSLNATVTIKPVQCPVCKTFNPVGVMFCVDCGLIFDRALDGDAFGAPAIQLPVLVDESGREHPLRPGVTVVGRQGDISVDDGRISRRHMQITNDSGNLSLEELGSTNGTKVAGTAVAQGQKYGLNHGEEISLGGYVFKLSLPGIANKTMVPSVGKTQAMTLAPTTKTAVAFLVGGEEEYPIEKGVNAFGRREGNAIRITDPFVSGKHGEFEAREDGIYLTDTGSTNGTILNDTKIPANQAIKLQVDDVIKLGSLELRIRI